MDKVVAGLRNVLSQARSLSFEIEIRWSNGTSKMAKVTAMRPNYYRVETETQWFISDGTATWQYFPGKNEYAPYIKTNEGMSIPLAPDFTLFSPPANYQPAYSRVEEAVFEGKKVAALVQEPKDNPNLTLRTFIDPETWLPVGFEQKMLDKVDVFVYKNVRTDVRFTPADFSWAPPKGAPDKSKVTAPNPLQAGEKAPDFVLPLVDGRRISLSEALKGQKGVIVNFWFINCGFCQAEMPELAALYRRVKGLEIIAVNDADKLDEIRKFLAKPRYPFLIATDEGGQTAAAFKVKDWGRPITFLIKPDGIISYLQIGYDFEKKLEALENEVAKLGIK